MHMSFILLALSSLHLLGYRFGVLHIIGCFRLVLLFQHTNISTQELCFVSPLEKSFVAYPCLALIPSCTRKSTQCCFPHNQFSQCHRFSQRHKSWSEPAPFLNPLQSRRQGEVTTTSRGANMNFMLRTTHYAVPIHLSSGLSAQSKHQHKLHNPPTQEKSASRAPRLARDAALGSTL